MIIGITMLIGIIIFLIIVYILVKKDRLHFWKTHNF